MNGLKEVLIFIGFSFRKFLANFLFALVYFFSVIFLTVFVFLFSVRTFDNYYLFIAYLVLLIIVHVQMKRTFFLKRQLYLNVGFVDFLQEENKVVSEASAAPGLSLKTLKDIKTELKKEGSGLISKELLAAIAALRVKHEGLSFAGEKLNKLKKTTLKYICINIIFFIIVLVPFALISFLFTRGFVPGVQLLVYLVGFLFVCFLNAAVFEPVIYLIIQAETYKTGE